MKIDFHSHMVDDYRPKEPLAINKHLTDCHLKLLKRQSSCEFFFWKIAGVFFATIFAAFLLQDKTLISNAFIWILFAGIGSLLAFAQNGKRDLEYGARATECVKKGIIIEKRQNFPGRIFQIFEENKSLSYRGNLLSRLFNCWITGISTVVAGVVLIMKIGMWLAVSMALFSIVALFLLSHFYLRISRKIILGR